MQRFVHPWAYEGSILNRDVNKPVQFREVLSSMFNHGINNSVVVSSSSSGDKAPTLSACLGGRCHLEQGWLGITQPTRTTLLLNPLPRGVISQLFLNWCSTFVYSLRCSRHLIVSRVSVLRALPTRPSTSGFPHYRSYHSTCQLSKHGVA